MHNFSLILWANRVLHLYPKASLQHLMQQIQMPATIGKRLQRHEVSFGAVLKSLNFKAKKRKRNDTTFSYKTSKCSPLLSKNGRFRLSYKSDLLYCITEKALFHQTFHAKSLLTKFFMKCLCPRQAISYNVSERGVLSDQYI